MAQTTRSAPYLFTIVCLCLYSGRSNNVEAALKLACPNSFEQEDGHSFKAISIFNKSNFTVIHGCQKNLSLSNVSVEMGCLLDGKSKCQTRLRFLWSFEPTVVQDLLKEVTLTLLETSPIAGGRQSLDCEAVYYDDYDDDDHHHTQSSSLEIVVVDYDCCNANEAEHGYYAILKATYDDDLPSCKVGTPLTLIPVIPAHLAPKEDDAGTMSSSSAEFSRGQEGDFLPVTIVIDTTDQRSSAIVRGAIVVSFVVVVCVVVVIVAYLCIRRGSNNKRRRFTERENSSQPFDLTSGSDDTEAFRGSSYLHNCPHCINETISNTIPDQSEILDSSGSDAEEGFGPDHNREARLLDVQQLDSGLCSGGPMFSSTDSETMRTFALQH